MGRWVVAVVTGRGVGCGGGGGDPGGGRGGGGVGRGVVVGRGGGLGVGGGAAGGGGLGGEEAWGSRSWVSRSAATFFRDDLLMRRLVGEWSGGGVLLAGLAASVAAAMFVALGAEPGPGGGW